MHTEALAQYTFRTFPSDSNHCNWAEWASERANEMTSPTIWKKTETEIIFSSQSEIKYAWCIALKEIDKCEEITLYMSWTVEMWTK